MNHGNADQKPSKSLVIRPFSDAADSRDEAFNLYCRLLREYIEPVYGWDQSVQLIRFEKDCPSHQFNVVCAGSSLLGYVSLKRRATSLHLPLLLIKPSVQRTGIGRFALLEVIARGLAEAIPITLSCFVKNPGAIKFYLRHGFNVEKRKALCCNVQFWLDHIEK